jgi:hypothetical protein
MKSGKFDPVVFVKGLGRELDTQAFGRSAQNRTTMINYFEDVT